MPLAAAEPIARCGGRYLPDFLSSREADRLFDCLRAHVQWQSERISLYGRTVNVPRLVAWCGDAGINYRYSGVDHRCSGWIPALVPVRERLQAELAFTSSLVLLNRYRDGQDSMGWHSDDEPGQGPWIASLSLGAPRRFLWRSERGAAAVGMPLTHGSLLLMPGATPHALPKTRRPVGERINLTFRQWIDPCHG